MARLIGGCDSWYEACWLACIYCRGRPGSPVTRRYGLRVQGAFTWWSRGMCSLGGGGDGAYRFCCTTTWDCLTVAVLSCVSTCAVLAPCSGKNLRVKLCASRRMHGLWGDVCCIWWQELPARITRWLAHCASGLIGQARVRTPTYSLLYCLVLCTFFATSVCNTASWCACTSML
jgi:hypothetical protein